MPLDTRQIKLDASWLTELSDEFDQEYMLALRSFLSKEAAAGKVLYPPSKLIFNALNMTPLDQVKVVILGQDPYHGPGQAHGLSFSVPKGVQLPPSLVNIFKEIHADTGVAMPKHGCLESWSEQGVLLLNSVLTVEHKKAGSHAGNGWERFTDRVIQILNANREGLVFLLWGSYAQKKGALIDEQKHYVLKSVHPSPLSAHRGFMGCRHFSKTNTYLASRRETPIDWSLSSL